MRSSLRKVVTVAACAGVLCLATSLLKGDEPEQFSDWGTPTWLGNVVNTAAGDFQPFISKNGLSLYFSSSRPGGFGGSDLYVAHRDSVDDPWGPAQNLGANINTASLEVAPALSPDEHVLFFASDRPGGFGGNDIWMSRRKNKKDDFGWEEPVNLGSAINTGPTLQNGVMVGGNESSPNIFEDDATGVITLYFDSNRFSNDPNLGPFTDDPPPGGIHNGNDIYASVLQPDGTFGPPAPVPNINTSSSDRRPTIRRDGLEMIFSSTRPGSAGSDLWVSTRAFTSEPWSIPVLVIPNVNSSANDAGPALSFDGKTLFFHSNRPGGLGAFDLWMATRTKLKGD
jgi:hypothetical protein